MDTDIRKPDTGAMQINRPTSAPHSASTSTPDHVDSPRDVHPQELGAYTEPLSEGEDDDEDLQQTIARDEEGRAGLGKGVASAAIRARQEMLKNRAEEPLPRRPSMAAAVKPRQMSIDPLAPSAAFDKTFQNRLKQESRKQQVAEEGGDEADGLDDEGEYDGYITEPVGIVARVRRFEFLD